MTALALLAGIVGGMALLVLAANVWVLSARRGRDYVDVRELPRRPTALLPGASRWTIPGRVRNPHFELRVAAATQVWHAGRVERIVISGGRHEVAEMCEELRAAGVPVGSIVGDVDGISTLEMMRRAASHSGREPAVVVGENWHLPRALFFGRALGTEPISYSVPARTSLLRQVRGSLTLGVVPASLREVAARTMAAALVLAGRVRGPELRVDSRWRRARLALRLPRIRRSRRIVRRDHPSR